MADPKDKALRVMKNQAGSRMVRSMTNGKFVHTSHYADEKEFHAELAKKNKSAKHWNEPEWKAK